MQVELIADAPILIPNKEHENFTKTDQKILIGTRINGEPKTIKGKRRGEDFDYKLFLTDKQQFIHLNKVKPMRTTEVTLGADAKQSPTVVDIPATKKMFTKNVIIATLVGAGAGYYYSAKMKKMENKKVIMFAVGGAVAGFLAGKWFEKRKGIVIKPSK